MDQNELRSGRDRTQSELHRLLAQGNPNASCQKMTRGCDGKLRTGDCRGGIMPRGEGLPGNIGDGHDGCGCGCEHGGVIGNSHPCGENGVVGHSLAMVYAPIQAWRDAYDPATALRRGTLFRELDMPFMGGGKSDRGGNCRGY